MRSFDECVDYILNIPKFAAKNSVEDTGELLSKVYHGTKAKIIHVAGTNGKGSTCAFMDSILRCSGYHVALFTSPHLVDIRERIVFDNEMISKEDFVSSFEAVWAIATENKGENHPSFFEFIFLMAMHYFGQKQTDYIILETGLGGRLDATNCVSQKDLCVITRIGLDHTEYLGDTLTQIAGEKAGIIKKGVPVVFWDAGDETADVFKSRATKLGCRFFSTSLQDSRATVVTKEYIDFWTKSDYYGYDRLRIRMHATYQVANAALAVLACTVLEDSAVNEHTIREGLLNAVWSGRMEQIAPGVFVDGAHNPNGIEAFLASVKDIECEGKRFLLFSVVSDKQYDRMIELIHDSHLFDTVYLSLIDSYRGLNIDALSEAFAKYDDMKVVIEKSPQKALRDLVNVKNECDYVFVAGSLYLVGSIKAAFC